jgi:hypothetical protein
MVLRTRPTPALPSRCSSAVYSLEILDTRRRSMHVYSQPCCCELESWPNGIADEDPRSTTSTPYFQTLGGIGTAGGQPGAIIPSMAADELPDDAMDALVRCVRSVVARQQTDPGDELFMWTRDYGDHGDVHLVLPPGPPGSWDVDAIGVTAESRPRYHVVVEMWTREEGRSDLSLEVDVWRVEGRWVARPRDLHVL